MGLARVPGTCACANSGFHFLDDFDGHADRTGRATFSLDQVRKRLLSVLTTVQFSFFFLFIYLFFVSW